MVNKTIRRIWPWLRPPGPRTALVGRSHAWAAARAQALVSAVYGFNLFMAASMLRNFRAFVGDPPLDLLWPVVWVERVGVTRGAAIVGFAYVLSSVLVLLRPDSRLCRGLCVATALPAFALQNSFGKINHGYHGLFWVMLVFVFLPSPAGATAHLQRRFRQHTLRVFWAAQATLLMFYSMSGALKLYATVHHLSRGEGGWLGSDAVARHVAHRLLQTDTQSVLGTLILEHTWLSPPFQLLTLYLELLAFLVAFRPAAHRLWAIGLIGMHLGIGLFMQIWFVNQIVLVVLVLGCSPFTRTNDLHSALRGLPVVASILNQFARRQGS